MAISCWKRTGSAKRPISPANGSENISRELIDQPSVDVAALICGRPSGTRQSTWPRPTFKLPSRGCRRHGRSHSAGCSCARTAMGWYMLPGSGFAEGNRDKLRLLAGKHRQHARSQEPGDDHSIRPSARRSDASGCLGGWIGLNEVGRGLGGASRPHRSLFTAG